MTWKPSTAEDRAVVLAELEVVLAHAQFAHSKRYPSLLRYLVEHTLDGDVAQIKERTLGIEVFGRPATYDTTNDTVVRFTASEVRRRLATFYLQHEDRPIHIALPTGSYIPEFLRDDGSEMPQEAMVPFAPEPMATPHTVEAVPGDLVPATASVDLVPVADRMAARTLPWRTVWLALAALLVCGVAKLAWSHRAAHAVPPSTALERFWQPFAHDAQPPLLVVGGNVFSDNVYSGTETASSNVDYPFVSMQIASAMARVSGMLQSEGKIVDVKAANSTTLSDLRDRPLILIGGYNNLWTERLSQGLPLRLGARLTPAIQDSAAPSQVWQRDRNLPYNASDDYALIGQYRDATTGSVIAVIAGIGRNGSEAAAQFLTDERRMRSLEQQMKRTFDGSNFEAVLRVSVIQGKTGAPTVVAVRTW